MYILICNLYLCLIKVLFIVIVKPFKLSLPQMTINSAHNPYTDSIKYLGFTFASSHKDDNDILRQMRMLYARLNRLVMLFHSCNKDVLLELGKSFC